MATTDVAELRAAGRWPEVWAALMATGGIEAVYELAATMTDDEIEADLRARQEQARACASAGARRGRISAQRSVLEHVSSQLPHSA